MGGQIKAAQALDLVAKQLYAYSSICPGRADVQDPPAATEGSRLFHHCRRPVACPQPASEHRVQSDSAPDLQAVSVFEVFIRGERLVRQRAGRGDDERWDRRPASLSEWRLDEMEQGESRQAVVSGLDPPRRAVVGERSWFSEAPH